MLLGTAKGVPLTPEGIVLPCHLHEGLGQGYVMTRGLDGCVAVFPCEAWEILLERIELGTTFLMSAARHFHRYLFGGASEEKLGPDGLLPIPEHLRSHAGLEEEVVLVGVGDRLEIWSPQRWAHEEYRMTESSLRNSEELSELGV
jgi:MraZ protein